MTDQEKQELEDRLNNSPNELRKLMKVHDDVNKKIFAPFMEIIVSKVLELSDGKIVKVSEHNPEKTKRIRFKKKWTFETPNQEMNQEQKKNAEDSILESTATELMKELLEHGDNVQLVELVHTEVLMNPETFEPVLNFWATIVE